MNKYEQLLLSELRIACYDDTQKLLLTEENMLKAMTVNENLQSLGYTLKAKDILTLGQSASLDTFYLSISSLIDNIPAKPMYPNFPQQVMDMSEATYRFHQIFHYFSTYGIEDMLPIEIKKGWLPDVDDTPKVKDDDTLLKAKVLELIPRTSQYTTPFTRILSKRERLTIPEKEIVSLACPHIPTKILEDTPILFKENLLELSWIFFTSTDKKQFSKTLTTICQHTGDVLRIILYIYKRNHYHFTKSQKKMFVRVLEGFPVADFKVNVIISNKKREEVLFTLQALDYQEYSKSPAHNKVVKDLREKKLHSWFSEVERLLSIKDENAISFIGQRPGMLLRMVAWLVRLEYEPQVILTELNKHTKCLSTQTLVSVLTTFGQWLENEDRAEAKQVYIILYFVLAEKMATMETPLKDKKVFVNAQNISLEHSRIETNAKSLEGGYLRSGIAIEIPENVQRLRFFVYWNDKNRVDIDLHAFATDVNDDKIHIGWNSDFRNQGMVMSGDITHSNAAEYIDVDLSIPIPLRYINTDINVYHGPNFKNIEKCFVGMLAVNKLGEEVKLYNPKNCFFSHHLKSKVKYMNYGYIDVQNRVLIFNGQPLGLDTFDKKRKPTEFSLKAYLDLLFLKQGAQQVETKEEADIVLTLEKAKEDNEISLLDNNFFMEF